MFTITGNYLDRRDTTQENIRKRRRENAEQYRKYIEQATTDGRNVSVAELEELKSSIVGGSFFDAQRLPSATVIREQALRQNQNAFESRTKQVAEIADQTQSLRENIVKTFSDEVVNMDIDSEEDVGKLRAGLLGMYGGDKEQADRAFGLIGDSLGSIKRDAVDTKVQKLLPRLSGIRDINEAKAIIGEQPKEVTVALESIIKNRAATFKTKEETTALGLIGNIPQEQLLNYEGDKIGLRNFLKTYLAANSELTEAEVDTLLVRAMPLAESRLTAAERGADREEMIQAEQLFKTGLPDGTRFSDLEEAEIRALAESALRNSGMTNDEIAANIDAFTARMRRQYVAVDSRVVNRELETQFKDDVANDDILVQALTDSNVPNREQAILDRINELRPDRLGKFTGNEPAYKELIKGIEAQASIEVGNVWKAENEKVQVDSVTISSARLQTQEVNMGALLDGLKNNELATSVAKQIDNQYYLNGQETAVVLAIEEASKGVSDSAKNRSEIFARVVSQFNLSTRANAQAQVERELRHKRKLGPKPGTSIQAYISEYEDTAKAKFQSVVTAIQNLPVDTPQSEVDALLQPYLETANQFGQSVLNKVNRFGVRFDNAGMDRAGEFANAAAGRLLDMIGNIKPQGRPSYAQPVTAQAPNADGEIVDTEFYRILPNEARELGIPAGIYSIDPQTGLEGDLLQYEVRDRNGDLYFPRLADQNIQRIRAEVSQLIATDNANKGRGRASSRNDALYVTSDGVPIPEPNELFGGTGSFSFTRDQRLEAIATAYAPLLNMSESDTYQLLFGQ
jgi:hypothetical protein